MSQLSTFFSICIAHFIYHCSFLVPRSKKIWVVIGWHTGKDRELFADNAKYFFLSAREGKKDVRVIWLSRDHHLAKILSNRGYEAYSISSARGIFYALHAGYTIIDAYLENRFWKYTGGSKIIQLWHGKGMKKTGYDSSYGTKSRSKFLQPGFFTPLHRLVASSPYTAKLMESTFAVSREKILETGLPRNDVLFHDIQGADIDAHIGLKNKIDTLRTRGIEKILLYAPTFRPNGSNPIYSLNLMELETVLAENHYHVLILLHPKFARKSTDALVDLEHISYLDPGFDIYPYLKNVDVLITDYSSLYVDFLLLDKPMIFYTYDYDTYETEMGLHDDYLKLTPGPHPQSFDELLASICAEDTYSHNRAEVRKILFTHTDGNSTERISAIITNLK